MSGIDNWRNADGRMADSYAGLRAAIAAGPTEGPFAIWNDCAYTRDDPGMDNPVAHFMSSMFTHSAWWGMVSVDALWFAAADPATIRTLLDERDRLAGELGVMRELLREAHGAIKAIEAESTEEADLLAQLLRGMEQAIVPNVRAKPPAGSA